jgi:hypothetical protein
MAAKSFPQHETRASAVLGGVAWMELDAAFLRARDPFGGGYSAEGSRLVLEPGPSSDVRLLA